MVDVFIAPRTATGSVGLISAPNARHQMKGISAPAKRAMK